MQKATSWRSQSVSNAHKRCSRTGCSPYIQSTGLASELLQGRYKLPAPRDASSLLARHEVGLFDEKRAVMASAKHHRGDETNRLILPYCVSMVESIGHRMAYEAAVSEGVHPELVDLYVASVVKLDPSWYVENAQLGRQAQQEMETIALDAVLPHLGSLIRDMQMEPYITAPIVSDVRWDQFMRTLQTFEGNAEVSLWRGEPGQEMELVRSHL